MSLYITQFALIGYKPQIKQNKTLILWHKIFKLPWIKLMLSNGEIYDRIGIDSNGKEKRLSTQVDHSQSE